MLLRTPAFAEVESMNRTICLIFLTVTMGLTLLDYNAHPGPRTQPATASEEAAIKAVLASQQNAWNQGDVATFMHGYWDSPGAHLCRHKRHHPWLRSSPGSLQDRLPRPASMGHLEFTDLEVHSLGGNAALVLGKWHLARQAGDVGGVFSLVFQRFPDGWKIVHDHTSVAAPAKP